MPLTKLPLLPGVFKDDTSLKSEGRVIDSDHMRVRRGDWQTVGGWEAATSATFAGLARGGCSWADLSGTKAAAWGTAADLYALFGGDLLTITPLKASGVFQNPFTTVSGSPVVTVLHPSHGLKTGDVVTFALADAVGGLTLNGPYPVDVFTPNAYRVTAAGNATSSATGGGRVEFSVPLDVGLVDGIGGLGYGSGPYGIGPYGVSLSGDIHARVWSLKPWGNNLLASCSNGALYEWQPLAAYNELVKNGAFDAATDWTLGTGWSITGGKLVAIAGSATDAAQDLTGIISGGVTFTLTFDVSDVTAGEFQLRVVSNPGTPTPIAIALPIGKNGSYRRTFTAPANPTFLVFAKDAAFAGKIDNVSLKVESKAYRITEAPPYMRGHFVDAHGIVVAYGTMQVNGDFNALCIRTSGLNKNRKWQIEDGSLAREFILKDGSEIRGGLSTRDQNLIWTDNTLVTMRYLGDTSDVFDLNGVGTGCGLIHKNACVEHNGVAFWWGSDGNFRTFAGGLPQIIECTMRADIMNNLAPGQESKISCSVNAAYNEVMWEYPDQRDGPGGIGGIECSRWVAFNWSEECWYGGKMDRTQWISSGVFPTPIALSVDGRIYFHELGRTANGDPLKWMLDLADLDMGDGETLTRSTRFVPDFKDQEGIVRLSVGVKPFPNGAETKYGPYEIRTDTQKVDYRHAGRSVHYRFEGEGAPAFARFGAHRVDMAPQGSVR